MWKVWDIGLQGETLSPRKPVLNVNQEDFPGGPVVKSPHENAEDTGRSLVQEGSTSCGAAQPACHDYWAHTP